MNVCSAIAALQHFSSGSFHVASSPSITPTQQGMEFRFQPGLLLLLPSQSTKAQWPYMMFHELPAEHPKVFSTNTCAQMRGEKNAGLATYMAAGEHKQHHSLPALVLHSVSVYYFMMQQRLRKS